MRTTKIQQLFFFRVASLPKLGRSHKTIFNQRFAEAITFTFFSHYG